MGDDDRTVAPPEAPAGEDAVEPVTTAASAADAATATLTTPAAVAATLVAATPPHSIADGLDHPLDPRYVDLARLIGGIITAAVALGATVTVLVLAVGSDLPGWVTGVAAGAGLAVSVALGCFLQVWPGVEHRYHAYRVGPTGIEIRSGVLWRRVVNVPRSRVQHTDVSEGPLERQYGLATLRIHTAGTEQAQVDLPGLTRETALLIRDYLIAGREDDTL